MNSFSFFNKFEFCFLEIRDFSHRTQQQIFDDILDQQVQQGKILFFHISKIEIFIFKNLKLTIE
jgi:hypothetical protein